MESSQIPHTYGRSPRRSVRLVFACGLDISKEILLNLLFRTQYWNPTISETTAQHQFIWF